MQSCELLKTSVSDATPIDLEEVKLDLRIDTNDANATLDRMIRAAGDFLEIRTGFVVNPGQYEALFGSWGDCFCHPNMTREFMRFPLRALESIEYLTAADTWEEADVTDFQVSKRAKSFILRPWPSFTAPNVFGCFDSIRVRFEAGFDTRDADTDIVGDPPRIPDGLKNVLIMLVGHYWKNRELFEADKLAEIQVGAGSMLGAYRQFW